MAKRILITDDALFMRVTLKNILTENGFEVVGEAKTGAESVRMYKELKPDLVTMDITMPEMDGITALKQIRASDPNATVVMCTSVERRWFEGARVTPTHGDFPNAVRDLAHELDAPLIDLTAFTTWLYEDMGPDGSRSLLSHFDEGEHSLWTEGLADDTHFHERGARRIAAFVGAALRAIERRGGDQPAKGSQLVH